MSPAGAFFMPRSAAGGVKGTNALLARLFAQGGESMTEKRIGRQLPTRSVVLPYSETKGLEAVSVYNRSGRSAHDWQAQQIYDIMALNDDGLWLHMMYGFAVARRNGKTEIIVMRSDWGLTHGERILYTAHRTTTSHSTWEKVVKALSDAGYVEGTDFKTTKQYGLEHIEWLDGSGAVMNFRTRSSKGGLGEGYDLLIIDEAQEYTDDQETALKYLVTSSQFVHGPQTLLLGTPPTAVSAGTVFEKFRRDTLSGEKADSGWAEWSVSELSDTHNVDLWYETNPSLGLTLTERNIRSELKSDPFDVDLNIQRLGLWLNYNQKSAITRQEWRDLLIEGKPDIAVVKLYIGIKYGKNTDTVSMAVAVKTADGKIFAEAIDCQPVRAGNSWMMPFLLNPHVENIVIDGASGQTILAAEMQDAGIRLKPVLPRVDDVIAACSMFEKGVFEHTICHADQPSLEQVVSNCSHRAIGSRGGFGYSSTLEDADITLLDAVTLAYWACATAKEKRVQRVSY